jgi:hypothetical protein
MNVVDSTRYARVVNVFFSTPGDALSERELLVSVVQEMQAAFLRRGITLKPWAYDTDATPGVAPAGGTPQSVVDPQIPRKPDGSLDYDLYVGIMARRIGTPVSDAVSGTVHEFNEARAAFNRDGKPHILFYFRNEDPRADAEDSQFKGVLAFRSQYPGLFSIFQSPDDLEAQFRRHLLSELLDLLVVGDAAQAAPKDGWSDSLSERYARLQSGPPTFLDRSADKPQRIMRHLHELLGINYQLSRREQKILLASLYCLLLGTDDQTNIRGFLGVSEIDDQVVAVVKANRSSSTSPAYPGTQVRLDLLAALVKIGMRLDISRKGITANWTSLPDVDRGPLEEWLAYLTADIVCQRGVVRFNLLAADARWIDPLTGATAVAMEALWQELRSVLTPYGMTFAVARPGVEVVSNSGVPESLLVRIQAAAEQVMNSLPRFPHFGEAELPKLEDVIPLPISKVRSPETFHCSPDESVRLLVNGVVVAEREASNGEDIAYMPSGNEPEDCVLECDEVGVFVPLLHCRLQRLSAVEEALLESNQDLSEGLRSFGLWNELLRSLWPRLLAARADSADLMDAFHILRDAFEAASQDNPSLLERRDHYWDSLDIVRNRIEQKKVTA